MEARNEKSFDDIEVRPLAERCLENMGYAPIRTVPVFLPRQIVQTRDSVVISSEDSAGVRVIHLGGPEPPASLTSVGGIGRPLGERHPRGGDHPPARRRSARSHAGRPLLLSRRSRIVERFTRVSPTELFYRFTVEDDQLYTRPWTGEFSMARHDGPIYEDACHERNYSLPNILRGGQAEAARLAAEAPAQR